MYCWRKQEIVEAITITEEWKKGEGDREEQNEEEEECEEEQEKKKT